METNELPEAVKAKIEEQVNFSLPDAQWSAYARNQFRQAIEIGYRLALQSKEEEVKQLNEEIVKRNWGILEAGALKMTIESLEEQLKAKDEEIAKFRAVVEKLATWSKNYPRGPIYPYSAQVHEQLISIENEAIELVSLLSQSTDKP